MSHTPGEWEASRDGCEVTTPARLVCRTGFVFYDAENKANAKLIAAAPTLLEVARAYERWEGDLVNSQDAWGAGFATLPTLTQPLFDRLLEIQTMRNAAISKATP